MKIIIYFIYNSNIFLNLLRLYISINLYNILILRKLLYLSDIDLK